MAELAFFIAVGSAVTAAWLIGMSFIVEWAYAGWMHVSIWWMNRRP